MMFKLLFFCKLMVLRHIIFGQISLVEIGLYNVEYWALFLGADNHSLLVFDMHHYVGVPYRGILFQILLLLKIKGVNAFLLFFLKDYIQRMILLK